MASLDRDDEGRLIAPEFDRPESRRVFSAGAWAFYIEPPAGPAVRALAVGGARGVPMPYTISRKTPVRKAGDNARVHTVGHLVVLSPRQPGGREATR